MLIPQIRNFKDGTTLRASPQRCGGTVHTYSPVKPDLTVMVKLDENKVTRYKSPVDKDNFTRIKQSGVVKMTPYTHSRITEEYFVSEIEHFSFALGWPHCTDNGENSGQVKAISSWNVARTYNSNLPFIPLKGEAPDMAGELNKLMSDVVSANLVTYDLLTELGELQKTIGTIMAILRAVRRPLETFRALANTYKKLPNGHKKTADLWLQYRYAIMPMVYSLYSITELWSRKADIYKTDRKKRTITDIRESVLPDENGEFFIARYSATHRLSAVGKTRYRPSDILSRLADQIQINPFVTAWELTPYSFVADWFANIGEWVLAQSSMINDLALERAFCRSVRTSVVYEVRHVAKLTFQDRRVYNGVLSGTVEVSRSSSCNNVVYRRTVESYERSLFTPRDVELQMDVFLDWKRALDAYALSQKPLIKSLRNFK